MSDKLLDALERLEALPRLPPKKMTERQRQIWALYEGAVEIERLKREGKL